MTDMPSGHPNGFSPRRFRFDDLMSTVVRNTSAASSREDNHHSGSRLVLVAGAVILLLWGALYLVFRDWRSRYRERASFGATQVATAVDPFAEIVPPGVNPTAWGDAVRETHAMLGTVTSANLLDIPQMELLRGELQATVTRARAHPETARDELAGVWNTMAERAAFVLREGESGRRRSHPRPAILPPRPEPRRTL